MVKWYNKDKGLSFCFSQILNLFICFIFKHNFAGRKKQSNLQLLITNNKYSNQVYVIKPINQWNIGLYQVSADHCEVDRDSKLNHLASAISGNPLL